MAFEDIQFPVYRKYINNKHFFKVISRSYFEEVQLIGDKKVITCVEAKQLPEMNLIFDLVYNSSVANEITAEEFELIKTA